MEVLSNCTKYVPYQQSRACNGEKLRKTNLPEQKIIHTHAKIILLPNQSITHESITLSSGNVENKITLEKTNMFHNMQKAWNYCGISVES